MYKSQLRSVISELMAQEPLFKPVFYTISIEDARQIQDKAIEIAERQGYLDDTVSKPRIVNETGVIN